MNTKISRHRQQDGFTIIELMLTIAIAGALLAVGIPSWIEMVKNNCLTSKTNAIVGGIQVARATAISKQREIIFSAHCHVDEANDGADGVCASSDEFGPGALIFEDIDGDSIGDLNVEDLNGDGDLDAGEDTNGNGKLDYEVIRLLEFSCDATANDVDDREQVSFLADGTTSLPVGADWEIDICDDRDSSSYNGRRITVSPVGRVTTDGDYTCP